MFGKERKKRSLEEKVDHAIARKQLYIYWDDNGFMFVSRPLQQLLGYATRMLRGRSIDFLLASEEEKDKLCLNGKREVLITKIALKSVAGEVVYFKGSTERIDSLTLLSLSDIAAEIAVQDFLFAKLQIDDVTNLLNKRSFWENAQMKLENARRDKIPLFFIIADIDNFGVFNSGISELVGDLALQTVAEALKETFSREVDLLARPHGDTFYAFAGVKGFSLEERQIRFKAVLDQIWGPNLRDFTKIDVVFPVTVTFGISYFDPSHPAVSLKQLIEWAEQDVQAKKRPKKS